MPPPSKRRKNRRRATTRSAVARLDALRDPIRQQEVQRHLRTKSERAQGANLLSVFADHEFIQLANHRAQALVELPLRIALSRNPFEAWRLQHQFALGIINDCELATLRFMKLALTALPK